MVSNPLKTRRHSQSHKSYLFSQSTEVSFATRWEHIKNRKRPFPTSTGLHHNTVSINFLTGSSKRGTSRFWFPSSHHLQTPAVLSSRCSVRGRLRRAGPQRALPAPGARRRRQPLPLPSKSARCLPGACGSVPRALPTSASCCQTHGLLASCLPPLYETLVSLEVPPFDSSSFVLFFPNTLHFGYPLGPLPASLLPAFHT